jgi:hypothetical protein
VVSGTVVVEVVVSATEVVVDVVVVNSVVGAGTTVLDTGVSSGATTVSLPEQAAIVRAIARTNPTRVMSPQ